MIEFAENMMIGVEHIDAQHKAIVSFLNKSLELCNTNPSREEIEAGLNFLASYVATHFRDEEKLQVESNYPGYTHHKEMHEDFVKSFQILKSKYAGGDVTTNELAFMLAEKVVIWVIKHVQENDVAFGNYYNQVNGGKNLPVN